MQLVNPLIIKNPANWFIVILMVVIGTLLLELLLKANKGEWDCGCGN
jgi:hypothetical protein